MDKKDFFNGLASKWDQVCIHDSDKLAWIFSRIGLKAGDKVLDVGTGTGVLIPYLVQAIGDQGEITAIDISENMIELAKQKHANTNVTFLAVDILRDDLPKAAYDVVIGYSVFPHFQNHEEAVKILKNRLKPGGKLVICHSQGREAINHIHQNGPSAISGDILPDIRILSGHFARHGLVIEVQRDDNELYLLIGRFVDPAKG